MGDDSPSSLVLFLISLGLLGAFVLVLWAINAIKGRVIMSRSQPAPAPDHPAEMVHVPIPATGTAQGTTAAAPSGTEGTTPDTHAPNAGTEAWEMPKISRRLSDQDMIALLAVQRTSAGKLRYSANQIAQLVGGSRAEVLGLIKAIREGPAEFRPLSSEQQATREALGLNKRETV